MKTCPRCGLQNSHKSDFCSCGEYLRWEATQHLTAVRPDVPVAQPARVESPTPPAPAAPEHQVTLAPAGARATLRPRSSAAPEPTSPVRPAARHRATVQLRLPGQDHVSDGVVAASVKAGQSTALRALIRNESDVVDNYDISVRGLPQDWWTVSPSTVYLVPYATGDSYEQEVVVELRPPRTPEALAKEWHFEVVVFSRAAGSEAAHAPATLTVEPYEDLAAKIAPDRASGRLKARFVVTVRNRANAPIACRFDARDAEGECRLRFTQPSVAIDPGKGVQAPVTVLPPKQIWLGRPKDRALTVTVTPAGSDAAAAVLTATYRQRPWLPWWLSPVVPILCAVVAAVLLLIPKQVVVPNLKHIQGVFSAEKIAVVAGLTVSQQVTPDPASTAKPGTIVDQAPEPGTKVKRGTAIRVEVAVGSNLAKVPSLVGSTPVAADQKLRAAHLVLGTVNPQPPDLNAPITMQLPAAGSTVADGTAVTVYVKGARATQAGKKIALPPLAGVTAAAAAQQLNQLGLSPKIVRQFSSVPAGQLIATAPSSGSSLAAGATVTLIASAGYPDISYDDGSQVHVVDGASGKPAGTSPTGSRTGEATWSPDGTELVYVQGMATDSGQLMLSEPNEQSAKPVALTSPASNVRDPAFAPNGQVLAFIDRSQGFGRLCFGTVSTSAPLSTNNCTSMAGYDLGGQISWSPDGKAILVFGSVRGNINEFGLIEFRTDTPFSPNAAKWDQGRMASLPGQPVIAGAFSPDGKHVALVSDYGQSSFHLFIAPANTFDVTKATMYQVSACQVSWRSDSQALAVVQSTNGCSDQYPTGNIVTLTLANPDQQTNIASGAENPSWQPRSLSG
jgi:beta-lactam-binding protein with PASTA domain